MFLHSASVTCLCLIMFASQAFALFGYTIPEQRRWPRHNMACSGKYQSPIALHSNQAKILQMPAIEMVGYHNLLPGPIKLHNNGHSVSLSIPQTDSLDHLPYIFGGHLQSKYELVGLHFHWGDKNNRGSEHHINDVRYSMEMHIIHRNINYNSVDEANMHGDGLCVLAFFFQLAQHDTVELQNIVHNLHSLKEYNTKMELNSTFSLSSLIGDVDTDIFYTYKGSLTTPPCHESVTWVLFPDPLPVTNSQMFKFRQLENGRNSVLTDNYRALQPLNRRIVYQRRVKQRRTAMKDVHDVRPEDMEWFESDN